MKSGTTPLKLAALLALGTAVHAAMPYLPLVGPPPLRAEILKSPATAPLNLVATDSKPAATNNLPILAEKPASTIASNLPILSQATSETNTALTVSQPNTAPFIAKTPEIGPSLEESIGASIFTLPTPNLLGITPQALVTYFHPLASGTNSSVAESFPLSFVPPMPPDGKSSHAEYIVK